METNIKIIIIPDIHGRTFWKSCVEKYKEEIDNHLVDVVFLGDYLDPYPFEGIDVPSAIDNFKDICEWAKNRTNVHMLLGNHDMPYYSDEYCYSLPYKCRYSRMHSSEIEEIFKKYDIFNIAWETKVNGKNLLFTHAGVLKPWIGIIRGDLKVYRGSVREEYQIKDLEPTAVSLNNLLKSSKGIFALLCVGMSRGGYSAYGSVIWADIHEHFNSIQYIPASLNQDDYPNGYFYDDIYQIFGHTLGYPYDLIDKLNEYYVGDHFAMLDSRQGFTINDEGKIEPIETKED